MLFAIRFQDKQISSHLREEHLAAHIEWLDQHRDSILIGGSLREEAGQNPIGGLWIVEAQGREDIETLIQTDPFWQVGLRESVEILHWSKAFPDRQILV